MFRSLTEIQQQRERAHYLQCRLSPVKNVERKLFFTFHIRIDLLLIIAFLFQPAQNLIIYDERRKGKLLSERETEKENFLWCPNSSCFFQMLRRRRNAPPGKLTVIFMLFNFRVLFLKVIALWIVSARLAKKCDEYFMRLCIIRTMCSVGIGKKSETGLPSFKSISLSSEWVPRSEYYDDAPKFACAIHPTFSRFNCLQITFYNTIMQVPTHILVCVCVCVTQEIWCDSRWLNKSCGGLWQFLVVKVIGAMKESLQIKDV